jgi:hypothetical protein
MKRYLVTFFKNVIGENGHEAAVCQGEYELDPADPREASDRAKRAFCDRGNISDWWLHADKLDVAETEWPS